MADDEQGVQAEGPMGIKVKATGRDVSMGLLILVCSLAASAAAYYFQDNNKQLAAEMKAEHQALRDGMANIEYILLQTQEKRDQIGREISMPESLRTKLRRRRNNDE